MVPLLQVLAAGISRFVAVGNQRSRKKQKDDAKVGVYVSCLLRLLVTQPVTRFPCQAESERRNIAALKSLKFMKAKVLDHKYNVTLVKGKVSKVADCVGR